MTAPDHPSLAVPVPPGPLHVCRLSSGRSVLPTPCACGESGRVSYHDLVPSDGWTCYQCGVPRATGVVIMLRENRP